MFLPPLAPQAPSGAEGARMGPKAAGVAHFANEHVMPPPTQQNPTKIVWSPKNNGLLLALFVNIMLFSFMSHYIIKLTTNS